MTDRFVASAKAAGARVDYFDEKTPGLSLRVSEGGHKSWACIFTSPKDGRRARITLGTYPATSLSRARGLALEAKGHLGEQADPRDVFASQQASALTVATLKARWFENHVESLRSAQHIRWRIEKNVVPVIGSIRLADLHRRDINAVIDPIVRRGRPVEANRVFEVMRAMFRWAVKRGDLDRNPMEGMAKPSTETARDRVLTEDEIRAVWNALPVAIAKSKAVQRILKLCLITGQRVGEVAGMRVGELDLKKAIWSLPAARTKNANAHTVPLSPLAVGVIKESLKASGEDADYLFPAADQEGPLDARAIAKTLSRAQEITKEKPKGRFGIAPWTAHDLRRTAITGMAQLGVEPIVIGAVANHLSVTKATVTFAVYVRHDYAAEKRRALELWANRILGIIDGSAATVVPMTRANANKSRAIIAS